LWPAASSTTKPCAFCAANTVMVSGRTNSTIAAPGKLRPIEIGPGDPEHDRLTQVEGSEQRAAKRTLHSTVARLNNNRSCAERDVDNRAMMLVRLCPEPDAIARRACRYLSGRARNSGLN
jgi:hypothetical protein